MSRLEKALSVLLGHGELTNHLAQVLASACKRGRVVYREIEGYCQIDCVKFP